MTSEAAERGPGAPRHYSQQELVALFASRQMERRWRDLPVARRTVERAGRAAGWPKAGDPVDWASAAAVARPWVWVDARFLKVNYERFSVLLRTTADRDTLYGLLGRSVGVRQLFALEGKRLEGTFWWLDLDEREQLMELLGEWAIDFDLTRIHRDTVAPSIATTRAIADALASRRPRRASPPTDKPRRARA
jgi:hypothetical protein